MESMSPTIGKLAEALSKAQGEMEAASKDADNPYFHSTYADLASCWDACREPLSKNGLAVIQYPIIIEGKLRLVTMLVHSSGEWISGEYLIEPMRQVKDKSTGITAWESSGDPQSLGSAYTYARRYSMSGIIGISSEDDDGEEAVGRKKENGKKASPPPPPTKTIKPAELDWAGYLKKVTGAKEFLGETKYYEILASFGAKHANEIKTLVGIKEVCENMVSAFHKIEKEKEQPK